MSQRREFLKQSAFLSAASLLPISSWACSPASKFKMGLQVYTIRDAMEKDVLGSLRTVKSLGYEDLELYGFDSEKIGYYGYAAQDFKQLLNDLGLTASSCHYGFADYLSASDSELKRYVEACIEGAKILGTPYITWPVVPPQYRNSEGFKMLSDKLNTIGVWVTEAGLGFAYHNHGYDFEDLGGTSGYDIVLSSTDPDLVKLQLDFYWVVHSSKIGPGDWIKRQPGRVVMWHIKDMDKVTRDYSELGNGSIDYIDILSKIDHDALEYYYIEQGGNFAQNSMQSITDSASYFKKNLKQYL